MEPSSSRARVLTLLATAAAAATAAFVASRLGVGGTIVGAALISVIASIGAEIYTTAAHRTTERVADLARAKRSTDQASEVPLTSMIDAESTVPAPDGDDDDDVADVGGRASSGPQDEAPLVSGTERSGPPLRFSWVHVAGVAGIVFLAVVGGITALELIAGRPLSSWWTDDSSTGTTIGQVVTPPDATPIPTPSPTGTAAPIPAGSPTALPTELPTTVPPPETAASTPPATSSALPTTTATPPGTTGATP